MSAIIMPGLTPAQILEEVRRCIAPVGNTDPDWKTTDQWGEAWGIQSLQALRILIAGEEKGKFVREKRRGGKRAKMIDHWRFVVPTSKRKSQLK